MVSVGLGPFYERFSVGFGGLICLFSSVLK